MEQQWCIASAEENTSINATLSTLWTRKLTWKQYCWITINSLFGTQKLELSTHPFEELFGADPRPGVDAELHLWYLLVDLLHEVDDEVDQLVPEHLLGVEVGDQETDVVALEYRIAKIEKCR